MYQQFFKRWIDFMMALCLLSMLSPLFLLFAIYLSLSTKSRHIFFLQQRAGIKGKVFQVIKFKSMTDEHDESGLLLTNKRRITRIGRFLRSTSLDELPQLMNVLIGDMSLVGPRPLHVEYLELYNKQQARRHDVRPGITGWAQVHGRNAISWREKFEFDVWYVDHHSFKLDLKILYKTVAKVLRQSNIDNVQGEVGAEWFHGDN